MLNGLDYIPFKKTKELACPSDKHLGAITPADIYAMVTDKIIKLIETNEELAWQREWVTKNNTGLAATNFVSKKPYRGINSTMLNLIYPLFLNREFKSPYFLTFKQVQDLGGKVKKGSEGIEIFYYTFIFKNGTKTITEKQFNEIVKRCKENKSSKECDELNRYAMIKYYNVFSADDVEGIDFSLPDVKLPETINEKIEICERIVDHFPEPKVPIVFKDPDKAYYLPSKDIINMPEINLFFGAQSYYSTLFHELVHSTGSDQRLNRNMKGAKGGKEYAFEELIAELGASFLNAESGILYFNIKNSAAYLKHWKSKLIDCMKEDSKFFMNASSAAQKAVDFILQYNEEGIPLYLQHQSKQMAGTISPAQEFIAMYADFHGKVISKGKIERFLSSLQTSIKQKQIRKTDKLAASIRHIQKQLIAILSHDEQEFKIKIKNVKKYQQQGLGFLPFVISSLVSSHVQNKMQDVLRKPKVLAGLGEIDETKLIVGKITKAIAKKSNLKEAAIYLESGIPGKNGFGLKHIESEHSDILNYLGVTAVEFVKMICSSYNEIRQDGNKIDLIVNVGKPKILVLALKQDENRKDFYRVITALIRPAKQIEKRKLLYSKSSSFDGLSGLNRALVKMLSKESRITPSRAEHKEVSKAKLQKQCHKQKKSLSGTDSLPPSDSLFIRGDQRTKVDAPGTFSISGEIGKFIQKINPSRYAIVLTGDFSSGKTQVLAQLIDAFADANKKIGWFSLEQGGLESKDTTDTIDRNIKPVNQKKFSITGDAPDGMATIKEYAKVFDVIAIDSWQKLNIPATKFDELRKEFPNTIWIVIFQQNADGGVKGGSAPGFDANVVIKVHKIDHTFINNYAELVKNRGNLLDLKYMVAQKKCKPLIEIKKVKPTKKDKK